MRSSSAKQGCDMNTKIIGHYLGVLLMLEAGFLIPPTLISLFDNELNAFYGLIITIVLTFSIGFLLSRLCRKYVHTLYTKDGMVLVACSWIVLSLFGALPFTISGEIPSYVDSFFEVVSGFTTTGASILTDVESMSRGLLFWRSFTHWLGGMGILVFLMALEPSNKSNSFTLHVMRAESPGPSVSKLVPKIGQTAKILYILYIILTMLCVVFLLIGGMPLFDSLCTAFGTAGTGGFGIKNDSIAGYSPYLQTVITIFMALFGVNFAVYHLFLHRPKEAFKDEEVRLYFAIMLISTGIITINILPQIGNLWESLHEAAFHVSSIMTTTGFAISDFNLWPTLSHGILLLLMVLGACAGSTGGGIKTARLLLMYKSMRAGIRRMLHPRSVQVITLNGKPVEENVLHGLNVYFAAYAFISVLSFLIISIDNFSVTTNFSAVLACFNNIGPGLDLVGPAENYALFSVPSKLVLTLDMLLGRLEIFPLLALLNPEIYRVRNK